MTRPIPFILASTDLGALIVNRLDYRMVDQNRGYGVGFQLLETGAYDATESAVLKRLVELRLAHDRTPPTIVDCGANIGIHTIALAKSFLAASVLAIEAQERIYYALAGNIALSNCFNARAVLAAVGRETGTIRIPQPNYCVPASFGSLELRWSASVEHIGQVVDYHDDKLATIPLISLDALDLKNVALIKIDVEGMEMDVLAGAQRVVEEQRPMLAIEHIKVSRVGLEAWLDVRGYVHRVVGMNVVAVHKQDPACKEAMKLLV